jgi:hypothetical protein
MRTQLGSLRDGSFVSPGPRTRRIPASNRIRIPAIERQHPQAMGDRQRRRLAAAPIRRPIRGSHVADDVSNHRTRNVSGKVDSRMNTWLGNSRSQKVQLEGHAQQEVCAGQSVDG